MRDEVQYRGPDDFGSMFFRGGSSEPLGVGEDDTAWDAGLGHRRLSILDLSAAGHQPMEYGGRYWITYNGEVYNYVELRRELEHAGDTFRSTSDTEVILAAYARWGVDCFRRMRGMWALAIYDAKTGETVVCRDRLGIKPLYLYRSGDLLAVVSEIKQLRRLPSFRFRADAAAATEYLSTGYEDPERTMFDGVKPLPAGHWARLTLRPLAVGPATSYWHPERVQAVDADSEEAGRAFADKFGECVSMHLRSDVPVGCALSGGLDSSSIAMTAGRIWKQGARLHTFTTTFPGEAIDERGYVDAVLARIEHEAHFDTPQPEAFLADLDRFVWIHDEPVASTAMYASYCLSRLTRGASVPVLLSGQGGDELFGAYWPSYFVYLRTLLRDRKVGAAAAHFLGALAPGGNSEVIRQVPAMWRRYRSRRNPPLRLALAAAAEGASRPDLLGAILNLEERRRRIYEMRTMFLPRLLKWDDRNSMAFSVEGRYPFLDHELIELVLSFRGETLYRRGWTKWPLRQGLRDLLPDEISRRRTKFGFETPQLRWLQGFMRPAIEAWLNSDRPAWDLLLREDVRGLAERVWNASENSDEAGQQLFRVFMFDRWMDVFRISFN